MTADDHGHRLRLLPIHPAAVLLGKVAFEAVSATITATAVLTLALVMGADHTGGIAGLVLLVALAAALAVAWNGIFYLTALTTRRRDLAVGITAMAVLAGLTYTLAVRRFTRPARRANPTPRCWMRAQVPETAGGARRRGTTRPPDRAASWCRPLITHQHRVRELGLPRPWGSTRCPAG